MSEAPLPAPVQEVRLELPARVPKVTYAILGFTVFVYLLQFILRGWLGYNENGLDLFEFYAARSNEAIRAGQLWRFITPIFLHASPAHIFFNMYALLSIGSFIETQLGHARFALLYFLSGFAGNVFSFLLTDGYSVGASTAVFGLIAAEGIFFYQNRKLFGAQARKALSNVGFIVVINLAIGLSPGIDNWGHVGGLLGGAMFAWFASARWQVTGLPPALRLEDQREPQEVLTGAGLTAITFGLLALWGLLR